METLWRNLYKKLSTLAVFGNPLILIPPGKVKVGLADFDVKLRENFLCTLFFNYPSLQFLQRYLVYLFVFHAESP